MRTRAFLTWTVVSTVLMTALAADAAAQTASFSRFDDAVAGRCYEPSTSAPDPLDPNRLRIGMAACTASAPNGTAMVSDTINFYVEAPDGYFVSKITFTQSGSTSGSRGGAGFRGATWVIDKKPFTVPPTSSGWAASVDLSLERKTLVPVAITTYLAAFGIQVVSGSASASNPAVLVELAPLQ